MVHALPYVAVAAIFVATCVLMLRSRDSDPAWEERWRSLDPAARKRIKSAVASGGLLADPEEIELGAALARREQPGIGLLDLVAVICTGLGVALIVAGLAADALLLVVFGGLFLLRGLWALRSELRIGRNLREAISRGRGF